MNMSLTDKEVDVILILRQLQRENAGRDFEALVCVRGSHLLVKRVAMPERVHRPTVAPRRHNVLE